MDASTLAVKMLQWEELTRQADAIRTEIETAVLGIGKTQTVGNVRATFSAGRRTFDYKAACADLQPEHLQSFAKVSYDYKAACEAYKREAPFTQSEASVTVKLLA
jgi:hypothetical protein